MDLALEIARILLPLAIVGGIAVFVIKRMERKYKKGSLGKKKSKGAQNLLDSLIPLGMLIGCVVGILLSIFSPISLLSAIGLGAGIGLFFGYFAYEIYSKREYMIPLILSFGSMALLYLVGFIFDIDFLVFKITPSRTEVALLPIIIGLLIAFIGDKIADSKSRKREN